MIIYCIPYLDLDDLVANCDFFCRELDAHRGVAVREVTAVDEHRENGALAYRGVADEDVLEDVVEVQTFLHRLTQDILLLTNNPSRKLKR
jgi:hypothetical protein